MAVWYDFYQTSGGAISRTSEERASEWYHTTTSLIKSYHNVTHVIIFLSYTTTPGLIEISSIPITPIYRILLYKHTLSLFNFTNYRLLELSNATSNASNSKKIFHKFFFLTFFPHKICIVSHSSYHTRRITLVVSHSHATSGGIWRILVR